MPDLGTKWECYSCGVKFYDLGRPEPLCPRCGANQKDAKSAELANESAAARRRKREETALRSFDEDEDLPLEPEVEADFEADEEEVGPVPAEIEDDLDDE